MCGIAGWINFSENIKDKTEIMEEMSRRLAPRGPDEQGSFYSPSCNFVHRRLVVIDPDNGKQPLNSENYTICYNGEIYNTADLQKELEDLGYRFKGHSDTEVLLMAYIQWGEKCLQKLNGIYAFAVWDSSRKKLFMARDRAGVKPLYYSLVKNGIAFASEQKALLAHPEIKPVLDSDGIAQVMLLGPAIKADSGIFKAIKQVPPGCFLVAAKGTVRLDCYWTPTAKPHTENAEETAEHLAYLIRDSVTRQLISDVPLCTFLSGGLDSSIISAIAAEEYRKKGEKLSTYSVDYKGNRKNFCASMFQPDEDAPWIVKMSRFIGSLHTNVEIDTPQLAEALLPSTLARDAAGMADVDSSLYLFCGEVKKGFQVAVSGECADEIFGGYPWFRNEEMLNRKGFPWAAANEERYGLLRSDLCRDISPAEYAEGLAEATAKKASYLDTDSPQQKKMREMFMLNFYWFMQTLLTRKDRCSMAHGLEVRVPFCDHRIAEYAYNIPPEIKFYNQREKGIVRLACERILPKDVAWRKKSPYPKTHNPDYAALMLKKFGEIIGDKDCRLFELMDREKLLELQRTEGAAFTKNWYGQLMTTPQMFAYMLQLEHWLRMYDVRVEK
ncbi:MAG: asparagine synthase (glutamine-hydrolyzing) [Firmicutes bacterium]|nr:asparagine synthase (glutamine-hydrolyzing) [[Eubacterium] siraeum]MCM1487929.1 asparagine synthase (glutamine-hydrolyzing) [Bacillota bacterium]